MSKIDDIFKKGLDGKGLEYQDAHWGAMEELIDANKKSLWVKYAWITGALLITGGILLYCLSLKTEMLTSKNSEELIVEEVNVVQLDEANLTASTLPGAQNEDMELETEKTAIKNKAKTSDARYIEPKNTDMVEKEMITLQENAVLEKEESDEEFPLVVLNKMNKKQHNSIDQLAVVNDQNIENSEIVTSLEFVPIAIPEIQNKEIKLLDEIVPPRTTKISENIPYISPVDRVFNIHLLPYVSLNQLNSKIELGNITDEGELKNSEKWNRSIGYGIQASVARNKWSLASGIELLEIKKITNYTTTSTHTIYETKKEILDDTYGTSPRGTKVVLLGDRVVDSFQVSVLQNACEDCQMRLNYVRVPLGFRYQIGKRRLNYFGEVGAVVSFLKSTEGSFALADNSTGSSILSVQESATDQFTKTLFATSIGGGVKYRLTSNWALWTSYSYQTGIQSIVNDYGEIPKLTSIKLGVEYGIR